MALLAKVKEKITSSLSGLNSTISKNYFRLAKDASFVQLKYSKPFENTSTVGLPAQVADSMAFYNNVEQSEYLYVATGNFFIEPFNGWVLDKSLKNYSFYSVPYSELLAPLSFKSIKLNKFAIVHYDKIISIQYYFKNYWHFFNDVLGQLAYLDEAGVTSNVPILVPAGALDIPYIRAAIASSRRLSERTWIEIKPNTLIQANTVITAKNLPNTRKNFLSILRVLDIGLQSATQVINRKIFIKRNPSRSRRLANSHELEIIAQQTGFEIIDNDTLSFSEQISLFQQARFVIGIHGAGLTNLMFRAGAALHLVELFPENIIPPHYYWLCNELGFGYSCLVGEKEVDGAFYVDPLKFKDAISQML